MMKLLGRIMKFIIGILFLPMVVGVSISFFRQISQIESVNFPNSQIFLWGVATYVGIHIFLFKLQYLYTFGHEVVHALTTWISGGKVTSFHVSREGGAVGATKSNFFITLSPYFVPFYTLLVSFLYFLASLFYGLSYLSSYFIFLVGFTLALHILSTVDALRLQQPDILKTGYVFSMALIYIINILLIAFIVSLLFREASFKVFFNTSYDISKNVYIRLFTQLFFL